MNAGFTVLFKDDPSGPEIFADAFNIIRRVDFDATNVEALELGRAVRRLVPAKSQNMEKTRSAAEFRATSREHQQGSLRSYGPPKRRDAAAMKIVAEETIGQ